MWKIWTDNNIRNCYSWSESDIAVYRAFRHIFVDVVYLCTRLVWFSATKSCRQLANTQSPDRVVWALLAAARDPIEVTAVFSGSSSSSSRLARESWKLLRRLNATHVAVQVVWCRFVCHCLHATYSVLAVDNSVDVLMVMITTVNFSHLMAMHYYSSCPVSRFLWLLPTAENAQIS